MLYLPKGQPVVFKLRSLDVIHSFFVPSFSEKLDAVPGITTTLRVTPTRLGTYPAECTELCGAGHSLMRATVRVVTPTAFQAWLAAQKANGAAAGRHAAAERRPAGDRMPRRRRRRARASSSSTRSSSASSSARRRSAAAGQGDLHRRRPAAAAATRSRRPARPGTVGPNLTQRLKSDCATAASHEDPRQDADRSASTRRSPSRTRTCPTGYHAGDHAAELRADAWARPRSRRSSAYLASVTK